MLLLAASCTLYAMVLNIEMTRSQNYKSMHTQTPRLHLAINSPPHLAHVAVGPVEGAVVGNRRNRVDRHMERRCYVMKVH